ncbi:MAG: hypothetical protein ABIS06_22360 [Vicinamibacterales bacterium]
MPPRPSPKLALLVAGAVGVVIAAAATAAATMQWPQSPEVEVSRYNLQLPPKTVVELASRPAVALSPDGRTVVFAAASGGADDLYVRPAISFQATQLPGTEGASNPLCLLTASGWRSSRRARLAKMALGGGPGKAVTYTVASLTSPDNYDGATIEATVLDGGARKTLLQGAR